MNKQLIQPMHTKLFLTRRDRCHLVGARALKLSEERAIDAWFSLAARIEEMGSLDIPKFNDILAAFRQATILASKHSRCDWHQGLDAITAEELLACPNCSTLFATVVCGACSQEFLDHGFKIYDDLMAGPYVTSGGDLYCTKCGPGRDRAEEESGGDNDFGDWPP